MLCQRTVEDILQHLLFSVHLLAKVRLDNKKSVHANVMDSGAKLYTTDRKKTNLDLKPMK